VEERAAQADAARVAAARAHAHELDQMVRRASQEVAAAWEARCLREAAAAQQAHEKLARASREKIDALEAELATLTVQLGVRRRNEQASAEAVAFEHAPRRAHAGELALHQGMDGGDDYARRNQVHPNTPMGLPASVLPPPSRLSRTGPQPSVGQALAAPSEMD